jgi:hypothetical protein
MNETQRFFSLWIILTSVVFLIFIVGAFLVYLSDRVIIFVLRLVGINRFFGTARRIAALIETKPDEWRFEQYRAVHKTIGTISFLMKLRVETPQGTWVPNRIERRIIRSALDRTITAKVRERVAQAAASITS